MPTNIRGYAGQELAAVSGDGSSTDPLVQSVSAAPVLDVIAVVPVVDAGNAYASGDLIANATAIAAAVRITGGRAILQSLTIIDADAQGVAFSVYFMSTSTSFGTLNGTPDINDANIAAGLLGRVDVVANDYATLSGTKVASLKNIGLVIEVPATTMWFAIVNSTGTPTFAASSLKLIFGFAQG
jgi:hypothetical protein